MTEINESADDVMKDIEMMNEDIFSSDDDLEQTENHQADNDHEMRTVDQQFSKVNITTNSALAQRFETEHNPVFLYRIFYNKLFPYKTYFEWLNYDKTPTRNFTHREFSFTLPSDIYIRFKSFQTADDLKKEIERIQPIKIDIGAIYSVKPNDKKTVSERAFKPLEKELVFDIDMTDYDEIRTCCSGGDVCMKCWEFMTVAIKVIDASLRDDFGFEQIMWVYSGRRGVHCWVCDESARKLDNDARKAIVSFLDVIKGGAQVSRKVNLPIVLHPSLERSYQIVDEHFDHLVLENMGVLDTPTERKKILDILSESGANDKVAEDWREHSDKPPAEKWEMLEKACAKAEKKKKFKEDLPRDIKFQYCYPRLDVKVSTAINHLLKSPFCVHPKTLRVCVPIKVDECESFNPLTVPNLTTLTQELDASKSTQSEGSRVPDYKNTSLKPYVEYFEDFVKNILLDVTREKRDEAERSMEF